MRGLKDAVSQLPSWPGFALGAVVIVALGGWYYGTTYTRCVEVRDGREALRAAIDKAAAGGAGFQRGQAGWSCGSLLQLCMAAFGRSSRRRENGRPLLQAYTVAV